MTEVRGHLAKDTEGVFITFEGGDGSGKTTHIRFLANAVRAHGREVVLLREPGGTKIGEALRQVVLDPENDAMAHETELLIYEAARAQIVAEIIIPALERGAVVLCDRFSDSTVAYQAYGRGLSREAVDKANTFACRGIRPHRTILLSVGGAAQIGLERATHQSADRVELAGGDFHQRVNEGFLEIACGDPERVRVVSSTGSKPDTAKAIFMQLEDLFPWMVDIDTLDPLFFERINERRLLSRWTDARKVCAPASCDR